MISHSSCPFPHRQAAKAQAPGAQETEATNHPSRLDLRPPAPKHPSPRRGLSSITAITTTTAMSDDSSHSSGRFGGGTGLSEAFFGGQALPSSSCSFLLSPLLSPTIQTTQERPGSRRSAKNSRTSSFARWSGRLLKMDVSVLGGREGRREGAPAAQIRTDPHFSNYSANKQSTFMVCGHTSSISRSHWTSSWTTNRMVRGVWIDFSALKCVTHSCSSFWSPPHSRRRRRRPRRVPRERRASLWHDPRSVHHYHARHGNNGTWVCRACVCRGGIKIINVLFHPANLYSFLFLITNLKQSQKYERKDFGECPRMMCEGQAVVPVRLRGERESGNEKDIHFPLTHSPPFLAPPPPPSHRSASRTIPTKTRSGSSAPNASRSTTHRPSTAAEAAAVEEEDATASGAEDSGKALPPLPPRQAAPAAAVSLAPYVSSFTLPPHHHNAQPSPSSQSSSSPPFFTHPTTHRDGRCFHRHHLPPPLLHDLRRQSPSSRPRHLQPPGLRLQTPRHKQKQSEPHPPPSPHPSSPRRHPDDPLRPTPTKERRRRRRSSRSSRSSRSRSSSSREWRRKRSSRGSEEGRDGPDG